MLLPAGTSLLPCWVPALPRVGSLKSQALLLGQAQWGLTDVWPTGAVTDPETRKWPGVSFPPPFPPFPLCLPTGYPALPQPSPGGHPTPPLASHQPLPPAQSSPHTQGLAAFKARTLTAFSGSLRLTSTLEVTAGAPPACLFVAAPSLPVQMSSLLRFPFSSACQGPLVPPAPRAPQAPSSHQKYC